MEERVKQVCEIVATACGVDPDKVGPADSQDTVTGWDSVSQIQIVLELEAAFGVSLSLEEIVEMRSVADICALLGEKV